MKTFWLKLFKYVFVIICLELGSMIQSPNYDCFTNQIENVQNKFLKLVCSKLNMSINRNFDNLQVSQLGLTSHKFRRKVADLMFL